MDAAESGFPWL